MRAQLPEGIDPARQALAVRHARRRRRLGHLSQALELAVLLGWAAAGGAFLGRLDALALWLRLPLAAACLGLSLLLVEAPMAWIGYRWEVEVGRSVQSPSSWLGDLVKAWLLGAGLTLLMLEAAAAAILLLGNWWWLATGVLMAAALTALAFVGPLWIAPLFFRFTPLADGDLSDRLQRLARRAGVDVGGVFTIHLGEKTTAANAAVMGFGRTRRVVLGDTLLDHYQPEEIEVVIAHELAHQAHRDMWIFIAVGAGLALLEAAVAGAILAWGVSRGLWHPGGDVRALPALAIGLGITAWLGAVAGNAVSRWRERVADAFALHLTGNGEAMSRAWLRFADQNLAEWAPPRWVELLTYSHPAPWRRHAMAQSAARG